MTPGPVARSPAPPGPSAGPRRGTARPSAGGFTLVELMIVVAIVIVLSVVAIGAYRKHMNSARKSEVYALFGEIRNKEEAYRAEFSAYLSTTNNEDAYHPGVVNGQPQNWNPAPAAFAQLGINPGRPQVYCAVNVIAGAANSTVGMGPRGLAWWANVAPRTVWWYSNATCDNDGNPAVNAVFLTSSDNNAVLEQNPQR